MVSIQSVLYKNTSAHPRPPPLLILTVPLLIMDFKGLFKFHNKIFRYWIHTKEIHLVILILCLASF